MRTIPKYLCILFFMGVTIAAGLAQDSTKIHTFDFNKLKPIVQVFGNASYYFEDNYYAYSFTRAHLGLQYQFNKDWSAKVIIDRGRATTTGEITVTDSLGNQFNVRNTSKEGAYYTMFLKFASLQWRVNDQLTLQGGAILQNHYITQERFWGLRYVAQTFQDLYWKIPSSDLGLIAYYQVNDVISFDAAVTNGEGVRIAQDESGKVKLSGGININPTKKLQLRAYYHNRQAHDADLETEEMYAAFVGLQPSPKFKIGGEFNYMKHLSYTDNLNSYGYSLYSTYKPGPKTELFTRYDKLLYDDPDHVIAENNSDGNKIIAGVSHSPIKGVNIALNYQGWIADHRYTDSENNILISMEFKF
ncbi:MULTISPECIES: hypothetical protein [unclassified Saccharicrinis]|uniref:hypothetical protein n=1 Tax=unclassified Saccharicrinis TaxID=2646859 RepID=UPI003D3286E6